MTPALQEINRLSLQSVLEQHHFSLRLILRSFCPDVRNFSTPLQWFTFVQLLYPYLPISWIGFSQTLSTIAVHNSTFGWFRAIAYTTTLMDLPSSYLQHAAILLPWLLLGTL